LNFELGSTSRARPSKASRHLRQWRAQEQSKHLEIIARWPQTSEARPRDQPGSRVGLRISAAFDGLQCGVELAAMLNCRIAFALSASSPFQPA